MKIDELDEWQGLTVEMLHSWLLSHGWRLAACEQGCGKELVSPSNRRCNVLRSLEDFPWSWALIETRMSAQSLLREINPRMRKGAPSEAATDAHDGLWLLRLEYTPPTTVRWNKFRKTWQAQQTNCKDEIEAEDAKYCLFWPCDAEGNKVRWPTDAEGKML